MALLNILQFPDPRLKTIAKKVDTFDDDLQSFVTDMFETMYEAQGIGLAAIQVNVPKHVMVIDVSHQQNQPMCLINVEIINQQGKMEWEEGCLSFPGVYAKVQDRRKSIEVKYFDQFGHPHQLHADDLLGVCIQHELDHLNGITFYDHLSELKQNMLRKKLTKLRRKTL